MVHGFDMMMFVDCSLEKCNNTSTILLHVTYSDIQETGQVADKVDIVIVVDFLSVQLNSTQCVWLHFSTSLTIYRRQLLVFGVWYVGNGFVFETDEIEWISFFNVKNANLVLYCYWKYCFRDGWSENRELSKSKKKLKMNRLCWLVILMRQ